MKKETLEKRITANFLTKTGTVKVKYRPVIELLQNPKKTLRPTGWRNSISARHWSLSDNSCDIREGLTKLKIDFEEGNDGPRGGVAWNYIRLTKKGQRQVQDYAKSFRA